MPNPDPAPQKSSNAKVVKQEKSALATEALRDYFEAWAPTDSTLRISPRTGKIFNLEENEKREPQK